MGWVCVQCAYVIELLNRVREGAVIGRQGVWCGYTYRECAVDEGVSGAGVTVSMWWSICINRMVLLTRVRRRAVDGLGAGPAVAPPRRAANLGAPGRARHRGARVLNLTELGQHASGVLGGRQLLLLVTRLACSDHFALVLLGLTRV